MITPLRWFAAALLATVSLLAEELGFKDTPMIPGTPWHVHDSDRPRPPVVTPGARFSQLAEAPSDATVLFDGSDLSKWENAKGDAAGWKIADGAVEPVRGAGGIRTKDKFADFQLHLEFATPAVVQGESQGRGNSGVLINGIYEVQILDSYNNPTYADGQAGALYGQQPPLVNASKPPGEWQSYDIIFESPRWDAIDPSARKKVATTAGAVLHWVAFGAARTASGKSGAQKLELVKKAAVTVIHNGVVLHHRQEYLGRTDGIGGIPHKSLGTYGEPHPPEVFIELQNHNNPVRFRNIWVRELKLPSS